MRESKSVKQLLGSYHQDHSHDSNENPKLEKMEGWVGGGGSPAPLWVMEEGRCHTEGRNHVLLLNLGPMEEEKADEDPRTTAV